MVAVIGIGIVMWVFGVVYGYYWGYRNGLKKLPDDVTSVIRQQAEEIAKKNIQELKDRMEGKDQ